MKGMSAVMIRYGRYVGLCLVTRLTYIVAAFCCEGVETLDESEASQCVAVPWIHGIQWASSIGVRVDGEWKFGAILECQHQRGPVRDGAYIRTIDRNQIDISI